MKGKNFAIIIAAIMVSVVGLSCEKENETNISSYENSRSHKMGQNCMTCHRDGKWGKGWFTMAGTVYDSLGNNTFPVSTVRLYSGPNGTGSLISTSMVDAKGNFYTTENIDFSSGLYPSVQGKIATKQMSSPVMNGQCNSCHGVSTSRIWTK